MFGVVFHFSYVPLASNVAGILALRTVHTATPYSIHITAAQLQDWRIFNPELTHYILCSNAQTTPHDLRVSTDRIYRMECSPERRRAAGLGPQPRPARTCKARESECPSSPGRMSSCFSRHGFSLATGARSDASQSRAARTRTLRSAGNLDKGCHDPLPGKELSIQVPSAGLHADAPDQGGVS